MDNLGGRRQRLHSLTISDTAPVRQRESSTPHDPSRRDHRTHAAYAAAELSGSCPQQPHVDRVQSPYAVSYSPSYNSKQRQTLSAQYSLASKPCNFRAFNGRNNGENGLFYQKSDRNSCPCHWADYAHLNIICKNKE